MRWRVVLLFVAACGDPDPGAGDPCIAANTCPPGTWVRVELPDFTAPYIVQSVVVDPVRPSDFYAFAGSNGGSTMKIYASTDFGNTWTDVNTTAELMGNPWGASIDPNRSRDPDTIPTLWTPAGYGAFGAWKSIDGGVTWQRATGADDAFRDVNPHGPTDLYHVAILPDDPPRHILATYHYAFKDVADGGFGESTDGGETWTVHMPPAGIGTSHYVIPISETTWAVIAQDNNGDNGIWRTTTAGRTNGTVATNAWTKVDDLEHAHGSHQNVVLRDGTILVTGNTNGARSTDHGATWTHFTESSSWSPPNQFMSSQMTNIAVTDRFIYTNFMANTVMARAPLDNPVGAIQWDIAYCDKPSGLTAGGAPFGMASSYDARNGTWVIVAGSYADGIWKYIEPTP